VDARRRPWLSHARLFADGTRGLRRGRTRRDRSILAIGRPLKNAADNSPTPIPNSQGAGRNRVPWQLGASVGDVSPRTASESSCVISCPRPPGRLPPPARFQPQSRVTTALAEDAEDRRRRRDERRLRGTGPGGAGRRPAARAGRIREIRATRAGSVVRISRILPALRAQARRPVPRGSRSNRNPPMEASSCRAAPQAPLRPLRPLRPSAVSARSVVSSSGERTSVVSRSR
jgi:hypothetical protein